jgi:hypothetical protein
MLIMSWYKQDQKMTVDACHSVVMYVGYELVRKYGRGGNSYE